MQQRKFNRSIKSQNYNIPAPIGGLNVRDSLDNMSEQDAIVMDNYIPLDTKVALRKGYQKYVSLSGNVSTLINYNLPQNNTFLAFCGGNVYDITSNHNIKEYKKNFGDNRWQYCQFKNRIIMVNGYDKPQTFYIDENGEKHFEELKFEGENLIPQRLINVCVSKQRLFFAEKGTLSVWYSSGVGEVQGQLQKFDMSTIARDGGEIIAIASWTQDGGQGIDDLTVFITSEGEVLVYSGNNPNNAEDWELKGIYRMSRPIGYRCVIQYQGDIVIISEDGYIPLSKALPLNQSNPTLISFSDKIRGLVLDRTRNNKHKDGWQGIIYTRGGYAIFNVPHNQTFEQHVINTMTGAWCRFTNIHSLCWSEFNERIYFGSKDGVYLFDEGYSDNKLHIFGHVEQAYTSFGNPNLKRIQLLNPRTKSSTVYSLVIYTNIDFNEEDKLFSENVGQTGLTKWNKAKWSKLSNQIGTKWSTLKGKLRSQWIANSATGFKASIVFKTKTRGNLIEWFSTGVRYEQGNGVL